MMRVEGAVWVGGERLYRPTAHRYASKFRCICIRACRQGLPKLLRSDFRHKNLYIYISRTQDLWGCHLFCIPAPALSDGFKMKFVWCDLTCDCTLWSLLWIPPSHLLPVAAKVIVCSRRTVAGSDCRHLLPPWPSQPLPWCVCAGP